MKEQTAAQKERQVTRGRSGRYEQMGYCLACEKSLGYDYFSFNHPDAPDEDWDTYAYAICGRCYRKLEKMTLVQCRAYLGIPPRKED